MPYIGRERISPKGAPSGTTPFRSCNTALRGFTTSCLRRPVQHVWPWVPRTASNRLASAWLQLGFSPEALGLQRQNAHGGHVVKWLWSGYAAEFQKVGRCVHVVLVARTMGKPCPCLPAISCDSNQAKLPPAPPPHRPAFFMRSKGSVKFTSGFFFSFGSCSAAMLALCLRYALSSTLRSLSVPLPSEPWPLRGSHASPALGGQFPMSMHSSCTSYRLQTQQKPKTAKASQLHLSPA